MFHNAKSNPMYDGSGTSMDAGSDFDPTARYFHSKDGTAWEPYTKEDNICIETAFVQWEKAAVCTNPSFEVRFGANATSKKTRLPSVTGFLQVNTSNENSRAVIRTAVRTVQDLHKEVAVLKEKLQAAEDATTRLYEKAATMKVSKKKSKGVTRSHSILSIASGSQDGHSLDALDPLLESFVTLADAAGPAAVKCRAGVGGMEVLQAAIGKDYTNKKAAAALRGEVAEFTTAMEAEISDRLASPQASTATVGQALVVIRVGTDSFKQVYESIGEMIIKQESAGMQLYSQAVDKLNALADQHSKKKPAQRKAVNTDAVQLMTDAVMTKSSFDSVVDDIVNECKKMGFNVYTKVGDIKNLDRIVQKGLFAALAATGGNSSGKKAVAPIVSGVLDVVRTMIVCISMKDAAGIIEMIVQMSKDGKVIVVRLKERFLSAASAGGWRDALINVYIPSGPGGKLKHICELQIVHTSLYMARAKLPGHAIYGKTRNAVELIELAFGIDFAGKIFQALYDLEKLISHLSHKKQKGRLTMEMAEAKVIEVAKDVTLNTPLSKIWTPAKQAHFLEAYLSSEWKECSFEDSIPFIELAKNSWDIKSMNESGTDWFGEETDMSQWAGVRAVNEEGYITELNFEGVSSTGPSGAKFELPATMAKMEYVTQLWLAGLTTLPPFIAKMPRLKQLGLHHCRLSGSQAVIDELKAKGVTVNGG